MNKVIYCPLALANTTLAHIVQLNEPEGTGYARMVPIECKSNCAWALMGPEENEHCCSIALAAFELAHGVDKKLMINSTISEGDVE